MVWRRLGDKPLSESNADMIYERIYVALGWGVLTKIVTVPYMTDRMTTINSPLVGEKAPKFNECFASDSTCIMLILRVAVMEIMGSLSTKEDDLYSYSNFIVSNKHSVRNLQLWSLWKMDKTGPCDIATWTRYLFKLILSCMYLSIVLVCYKTFTRKKRLCIPERILI